MDSFVLLAYASWTASRTFLQRLLACINFVSDSEDLFCYTESLKGVTQNLFGSYEFQNR